MKKPRTAGTLLREAGFDDTKSVAEQGWVAGAILRFWQAVQDEGRFFITADKRFGDILVYRQANMPGTAHVETVWD